MGNAAVVSADLLALALDPVLTTIPASDAPMLFFVSRFVMMTAPAPAAARFVVRLCGGRGGSGLRHSRWLAGLCRSRRRSVSDRRLNVVNAAVTIAGVRAGGFGRRAIVARRLPSCLCVRGVWNCRGHHR